MPGPAGPRPRVSVLINNYNYAPFVSEAIDSALAQRGVAAEIIVVDDGSTDASRAVLSRYADRAHLVLKPNGGQASAMNAGVAASRGEFLCFLDADDWWREDKLAAVVAAFDADPRVGLVYHRLQPAGSDRVALSRPIPRTLCAGDIAARLSRSAGWWPFPMTSAVAVRRSLWDAVGPIPESFRISADAWLVGIYPFLAHVAALPEALGFYRIHANAWHRAQDDAAMLRRRMAHWRATVELSNRFLTERGLGAPLRMEDHFPHRAAMARLGEAGLGDRIRLVAAGLRFGGEPNMLRRARAALRAALEPQACDAPAAASQVAR
jgi:glycosyltransferase involved in cell wall biosynthesis